MLGYAQALERVLSATRPLGTRELDLSLGSGRVLAAPVTARMNQPPFDGSAMDGYAVRADDTGEGAVLTCVGESQAGAGFSGVVQAGQCVRIFTGAPMPDGADAVVMQEHVNVQGDRVTFSKTAPAGQNVRPMGQDFSQGETLLEPGVVLNPPALALIAAANVARIEVFRRPTIGLMATGDELMPPGSELKPGQIVSSNGFALGALLAPLAREIIDLGNAPDDEAALRAAFKGALEGPADVIISTGGASVGDHDLVLPVLKSLGVDIDFWKIAMRPGKPIMFARWNNKLIFALPGNPVSAYVGAVTVVMPALRAMAGQVQPEPETLFLPLRDPLPANSARRHFMRCKLVNKEGRTYAAPITQTDSSHLSSLAAADGLIVVDENQGEMAALTIVPVIPLP